ncbi:MAG: DUF1214 domain-containing protein [Desulfobacteraceae bacterium]|nr:DUF1214 domain-containing protein [Desulfobacteraceae bacterium]
MKRNFLKSALAVAVIATSLTVGMPVSAQETQKNTDWREDYAYTLGVQAYIFSFPWVFLPKIEYQWVVVPPKNAALTPNMPLNQWWHARNIITSDYRDGGAPNNDTLCSATWLDVGKEPIILSHGDMDDRYFTFEIASMNSDNFAYVGASSTGSNAGHFAITGRDWKGTLPEGVTQLLPSPTDYVLILGRTAVRGADDVPAVHKAQDTYKLTPLSLWGKADAVVPENRDVPKPFDPKADPLADWKTINRAMVKNPPLEQHAVLLDMFKQIGVGPGLDVETMDDATKRGLARAAKDGMQMLQSMLATGLGKPKVNGWSVPPATMGRAMIHNDFITLALQCLGGIISNDPSEAIYFNTHADADGNTLNGANKYTLRFEPNQLPDVKYFWSLTMYDLTNNLVPNPIDRWAIGSLAGGYQKAADGSLTLYLQKASPGKDKEANWLPAPAGDFWVVFRTYGPGQKIVDQAWTLPPLKVTK